MGLIVQKHSFTFNPTLRLLACCQLAFLSGCGGDPDQEDLMDTANGDNAYIDDGDDFGIAEIAENLGTAGVTCSVAGTVVTVTIADAGVAMISKSPTSTTLLVNGGSVTCAGFTPLSTMTVVIARTTPAAKATLILDYMGGMFGAGTALLPGVDAQALIAADVLKIRATKLVDTYVVGTGGIGVDAGNFADIKLTNATAVTVQIALGEGADIFTTAGSGAVVSATNTIGLQYAGLPLIAVAGGNGIDTFKSGLLTDGAQSYSGGGGVDIMDYSLRTVTNSITVTTAGAADDGAAAGAEADNVQDDIETIKGGTLADTIDCSGSLLPKIVSGGAGDDILTGSPAADTLNGEAGNDTLNGGLGIDIENGGDGNDTFSQGAATNGADLLAGGAGQDLVSYGSRLAAITVDLSVVAGDGLTGENDSVAVDIEDVTGAAGAVVNTLTGSAVANVLTGGSGADIIKGGAGDDTILGGGGIDNLKGEDGDDVIECGGQADVVDCGLGDDILFDVTSGSSANCEL